jgi:hypothetical protein
MWRNGKIIHKLIEYWYQAKVYDSGSKFGINDGRVSKLSIYQVSGYEDKRHGKMIYNYDRGLDFDRCPAEVLAAVLDAYS